MEKNEEIINKLLSQYINLQLEYVNFTNYMNSKIRNLLIENDIHYQSITSRVKDVDSLKKKLYKLKSNLYKLDGDIRNLNDLSGIRIIIYDRDKEDIIKRLLEEFFEIKMYSSPKENYDAINITISLKDSSISKFNNMKCEIQIVVILSHALIEFGHDIFYKDKEELKKKDNEEYEKLKDLYDKSFEKVIQLETTMKLIKTRANNIKNGHYILNSIIEDEYIQKIRNANDCNKINKIIEELNSAIEPLCKSENSKKIIIKNHLIIELVKSFVNIPNPRYDEDSYFYFGTFRYTYEQLIDVLSKYIYLWQDDFEKIINTLYRYIEQQNNEDLLKKLSEMIKSVLKRDKINNSFGLYRTVFNWIVVNPEECINLKLEAAIEYCNLDLHYSLDDGYMKMKLCNRAIAPNKKYMDNIKKIIKTYCEIFINKKEISIFNKIKYMCNMDRDYKETKENFKVDCMLDFFNEHFEQIDAYIKWELYKFAKDQEKDLFYNNEIYKKIKSDRICILYSYLYSYFLDDIPSKKHEIIEVEREKYLKNYIESFKEKNEKEIIEICKLMDIYEDELYSHYFNISIFLYNIGRRYKNAIKLYEKTNNIYILLGLYDKEYFKININNDEQVKKILKYSSLDKNIFSERLFKQIVNYYNIGNSYIVDNYICKIIFSNKKIFNTQEYRDKAINIVRAYNKKRICILNGCIYIHNQYEFIKILKKQNLNSIFINLSYKRLDFNDEILMQKTFEVYPNLVRNFIRKHFKNYKEKFNRINSFPIYECSNFDKELYNNILFCLELLKENEYYKVSEYVRILVGKYNENIFKYVKELIDKRMYIKEIVYLLKILDVSILGWNAFECILSVTTDQDIKDEIECILFDTVASGEYGLANSFEDKYKFFNKLSKEKGKHNANVMKFVNEEKENFRSLYLGERLKVKKRIISEKEKYDISNKSQGEDN